jgi:uncharacterized Tic20 family protein
VTTVTRPVTVSATETESHWAMIACLGAIFLGPFAPLLVWLAEGRRSPFVRAHVIQALNLTLTFLLYTLSALIVTGLLALASLVTALVIISAVFAAGWAFMVVQLIRCASAARLGAFLELPRWACATIISH